MLDFLQTVARQAGEICLQHSDDMSQEQLDFKGARDLVTVVDKKVEDFIISAIRKRFGDHDIIGEETGKTENASKHCWIIDPIDGTTSYFHGQPYYSVSVAYCHDGVTKAGVVYAPALGQMFTAEKGKGAWLNGNLRLQVSTTSELINSLLATGFACLRAGRTPNNLEYLARILPEIRDIRRCGSAAIDLAYVAAGKVDGYWEMELNIYDVAAGVLLVQEAGGRVYDMRGGDNYPEDGIVAANSALDNDLLALLRKEP